MYKTLRPETVSSNSLAGDEKKYESFEWPDYETSKVKRFTIKSRIRESIVESFVEGTTKYLKILQTTDLIY